jgi:3-deoxy-D-manno-octulosonic-acid transferase
MFIIYDLIFLLIAIIYLPFYLLKKKFHKGFFRRLGLLPRGMKLNKPIWIHAVSVGEVMVIRGLLEELRGIWPGKSFVISTVTPTGNKIARGIACEKDFITYLPLDLSFIVRCVIDRIEPALFIIAETELWPNLISYLKEKNIPIIIVNARISDSSFSGYSFIKFFIKPFLKKINLFCVQTNTDAQRLISLGVPRNNIETTGNMKFDLKDYTDYKKDYTDYKLKMGLKSSEKLLVAASTHPGEEEFILGAYRKLLEEFPDLRLLIAPRHPQRAKEIEKLVARFGFQAIFISILNLTPDTHNLRPVFILDTVGELLYFYSIADIVFVGGSLVKKGGHNILEPASLEKAILFGPYMFNFRDIRDLFLQDNAAILVHNREELKTAIRNLLNNPGEIATLGRRAKNLILSNQGATKKNLQFIFDAISW